MTIGTNISTSAKTSSASSLDTIRILPRKIVIYDPTSICFCLREQGGRLSVGVQFNIFPEISNNASENWWDSNSESPWIEVFDGDHLRIGIGKNFTESHVKIYFPVVQQIAGQFQVGCNVRMVVSSDHFQPCEHINPDKNFQKTTIAIPKAETAYAGQRFSLSAYNKEFAYKSEPLSSPTYASSNGDLASDKTNVYWMSRNFIIGLQKPPQPPPGY